jgi:hypothetical protein
VDRADGSGSVLILTTSPVERWIVRLLIMSLFRLGGCIEIRI